MLPNRFNDDEKLYRAVLPKNEFWKTDGTLSSAAFKDKNGVSVERGYYRPDEEVAEDMLQRLQGNIVSITVKNCNDVKALVLYKPSAVSEYHSEIHSSETKILLTDSQRKRLASCAKILK